MFAIINKILDWFKSLFWKEGALEGEKVIGNSLSNFDIFCCVVEMELTLVGLQYSGELKRFVGREVIMIGFP
jgi:hypothetical protein